MPGKIGTSSSNAVLKQRCPFPPPATVCETHLQILQVPKRAELSPMRSCAVLAHALATWSRTVLSGRVWVTGCAEPLDKEVPCETTSSWYDLQLGCIFHKWSTVGSWWASHTPVCVRVLSEAFLFTLCLMCIPFKWREEIEERVFEGKFWPGVTIIFSL